MAGAIERRHHIGNGQHDQKNQSQDSGDAQRGRFRFDTEGWTGDSVGLERYFASPSALFKRF
jgi:hypothetical protein